MFDWDKMHGKTHPEISYPRIVELFLSLLEGGITNPGIANSRIVNPRITSFPIKWPLKSK